VAMCVGVPGVIVRHTPDQNSRPVCALA
jgi:hypothetical protein